MGSLHLREQLVLMEAMIEHLDFSKVLKDNTQQKLPPDISIVSLI
jgi:hypothetical protein